MPAGDRHRAIAHRHAETDLLADQPVAVEAGDPRVAASFRCSDGRHFEVGAGAGEQRVAVVGVAPAVADVPLPRGLTISSGLSPFS